MQDLENAFGVIRQKFECLKELNKVLDQAFKALAICKEYGFTQQIPNEQVDMAMAAIKKFQEKLY